MTKEERLQKVKEKIESGTFELDYEDGFLLNRDEGLFRIYVKKAAYEERLINEDTFDKIVEAAVSPEELDLTEKERSDLWYNIAHYMIYGQQRFGKALIEELLSYANVNEEYQEKIRNLVPELLTNRSIILKNFSTEDETLEEILNYKRYDMIAAYVSDRTWGTLISEEMYQRIKKEFPFDQYPYPELLKTYENRNNQNTNQNKNDVIENLAKKVEILEREMEDILVARGYEKETEESKELDKKIKELNQEILSSMRQIPTLINYNNCWNFAKLNSFMDDEEEEEFHRICFEKNFFDNLMTLRYRNIVSDEDIMNKVYELIDKNIPVPIKLAREIPDKYRTSDRYLNYLIKQGRLDILLSYDSPISTYKPDLIEKELYQEVIRQIILEIQNGNPNYDSYIQYIKDNYDDYPEILQAIINTGRVQKINLRAVGKTEIVHDLVASLIKDNKEVILVDHYDITSPKLMRILLESNRWTDLDYIIFNLDLSDPEIKEILIQYLDNAYIADKLLQRNAESIIKDEELLQYYIKDELFLELLLEKVNHEEALSYFYNHEIFEKIKEALSKKYNLNLSHLEIVEEQLGAEIIRYIDNPNIGQIINLKDETFYKIMDLFPKTQFDMKDLEAAYDSLIQYLFTKENIEDTTIFASFIQALEQKDINRINEIKQKLLLNIHDDFIAKLIKAYNIQNVNTKRDFLNKIIEEYQHGDKATAKQIIHNLTNEYILTKRKEYHNNQYFAQLYKEEYHIFDRMLEAIEEGNSLRLTLLIEKIVPYLNKGFYKDFSKNKKISTELENPKVLLRIVIENIKNPEKREKYLPVLKEITDYYIFRMTEDKHREIELGAELKLPYTLEEKSKENAIIKFVIGNATDFSVHRRELQDIILEELQKQGLDNYTVKKCLDYIKNPSYFDSYSINLIQPYIGIVIKNATKIYKQYKDEIFYDRDYCKLNPDGIEKIASLLDKNYKIRRLYSIPQSQTNMYQILAELNIDVLEKSVFSNPEVYNTLLMIMQKRKLHLLPSELKPLIERCSISDDLSNISGLINFFATILEEEQKRLIAAGKNPNDALSGLTSILIQAETYSSLSSVYSQILGQEDAKLIKSNPGPNSANNKIKNNQRLKEAIEWTIKNFKRQEITIPPFDKNIEISSPKGKKNINVIVGNFTDTSNLTHGERTGACMRIGGVGESLFQFCLKNPNGFHIRFEDPDTHEYISRVSGFRNGNTVFLNELRYSCNPDKYTNEDVVEACKQAANYLIELSKDSTCPIENVVISNQYAMGHTKNTIQNLGVNNIKEGLSGFYSDVDKNAIVLATTATDGTFVPINFDKRNVPTYQPCRPKIRSLSHSPLLINKINRVASIKTILEGTNYEDVSKISFPKGIIYGIVSDDWYIYVDRDKNIIYDYIPIDPRAKEEMVQYIEVIQEMLAKNEIKDDEYGIRYD